MTTQYEVFFFKSKHALDRVSTHTSLEDAERWVQKQNRKKYKIILAHYDNNSSLLSAKTIVNTDISDD